MNLLFSRQSTEYFEVMILTPYKRENNFFDLIKPVKVFYVKYRFKNKISLYFTKKFKYYEQGYNPGACGRPVIISNSGNLISFVRDSVNGSMIEERDEESLTEKILLWRDKLQINRVTIEQPASGLSGRNIALNYKKILIDSDHSLLNDWF